MVAVIHPTGNANVRAVLEALDGANLLGKFVTTVAVTGREANLLPSGLRQEAMRRSYPIAPGRIERHLAREMLRVLAVKLGAWSRSPAFARLADIDGVCRALDRRGAEYLRSNAVRDHIHAVYCYEDTALETFRRAKALGIRCLYDLPIGYFPAAQRIRDEDRDRMPEFADAFSLDGVPEPPEKLERKENEARLAERIIACSEFVKATLVEGGVPQHSIRVVQFGSPEGIECKAWSAGDLRRPLRILFAGLVLQRKGIGYLLHAVQRMRREAVELVVMGRMPARAQSLLRYRHLFRYEPPRPHQEVLALMKTCDLLVLPSLFEGQALVVLEAMKCGLPVVITPNTGAANLVENGREGFVVSPGSVDALLESLEWFAAHREAVEVMGTAARKRAEGATWRKYRAQIVDIIKEEKETDAAGT